MAIKYYSEKAQKFFDNAADCEAAEREAIEQANREKIRRERAEREAKEKQEKMAAERKARAAEVEEARKTMVAAQKKYQEILEAFIKQFGSYHYTSQSFDDIPVLFSSFFDWFK